MSHLGSDRRLPLIWGHRGASDVAPENTLAAFRAALEGGADGIELDVTRCGSGEIVVIHDDTVDRTTNASGHVATMPLDILRELDAGARFGAGFAGEHIPTLEQVLDLVGRKARMNIEIKSTRWTGPLEAEVAHMVRARQLEDQVIISSFDAGVLRRLRRIAPTLKRAILYSRGASAIAALWFHRFFVRPHALHPHWQAVDDRLVHWAHQRGYQVNVWTVDDPATAQRMADLGVDGIITNCPARLCQLVERGSSH